jgi:hypothetical protein
LHIIRGVSISEQDVFGIGMNIRRKERKKNHQGESGKQRSPPPTQHINSNSNRVTSDSTPKETPRQCTFLNFCMVSQALLICGSKSLHQSAWKKNGNQEKELKGKHY